MGCAGSKSASNDGPKYKTSEGAGGTGLQGSNEENFRERLFAKVGTSKTFAPGDHLIVEGKALDAAVYIRKGTTTVLKRGKEVAKRSKGDLVGEMSLLLGELPGVTITAETPVEALIVEHAKLMNHLADEPKECGPLFRMMAATLSERIGEASGKMRSEVVAKNAKKATKKGPVGDVATLNVAKYRQLFNLNDKNEQLMLRTKCSMRKEANALKVRRERRVNGHPPRTRLRPSALSCHASPPSRALVSPAACSGGRARLPRSSSSTPALTGTCTCTCTTPVTCACAAAALGRSRSMLSPALPRRTPTSLLATCTSSSGTSALTGKSSASTSSRWSVSRTCSLCSSRPRSPTRSRCRCVATRSS